MAVINTNVKALFSQAALTTSGRAQQLAMQQLSTGKRINSARDDAAGMAIATRMTEQIRGLNQAVRNAGDAITLIQTAEGATNQITDMMQRMRELAVQAVNDTNDNAQRSYLDLEFQQLKQQIVQISDNTQWNGFPVLNGTAGQRVGEMPVYKATSQNISGSTFINPTTSRTIAGADSGEKQTFTIAAPGAGAIGQGTLTIAGQSVDITAAEAAAGLATVMNKIQTTLNNSTFFNSSSGRSVVAAAGGLVTVIYNSTDGDVPDTQITLGSTNLTVGAVATTRKATVGATEAFNSNGKFLQSGSLRMSLTAEQAGPPLVAATVSASFLNEDNKVIPLTATINATTGKISFDVTAGLNRTVMSDNLSYTLNDPSGTALDLTNATGVPRNVSLSVDVSGSIPVLRAGDLKINDVVIGPSQASDDLLSPRNNASGSAIAKAAAINRMAVDQGKSQGKSQSITLTGTPAPGTVTVGGVSVVITSSDQTPADVAQKIAVALQASSQFGQGTGRVVTYASGSGVINVSFPVTEADAKSIDVQMGATGLTSVVNTTQPFLLSVPGTGVFAKVNENVVTGKAMTGSSVVSGAIFINGYTSADITTVLNNPQATRASVVRAINLISDKTGVQAIDTGSDAKGVTLVAADGRNIEVRFETTANAQVFGDRVGLQEGVQSSTISLESKIDAPVVLSSASNGDISRVGFRADNYSKNQAVLNTITRDPVAASQAQIESINFSGTATATGTASIVINGTTFTSDAFVGTDTPQTVRDNLITKINANATLGVYASAGRGVGEVLLTAKTPGMSFTMTSTKSTAATGLNIVNQTVASNSPAKFANLTGDDLTINGVKIRASTSADDSFSNTVATSSDRGSSAIAVAAAINASTSLTGVRAEPNPVISQGVNTTTGLPASGKQSLWVNGTQIDVDFVQNELGSDRRAKVIAAINQRVGQHGVTAKEVGNGVTLSSDGRNLSVWFDSSIADLSAASFGLDKGGSIAQQTKVKFTNAAGAGAPTATIVINGVTVTASPAAAAAADVTATAMMNAINATASLKNVLASIDPNDNTSVLITSKVPGSAFDVRGASVAPTASTQTLSVTTVTPNSLGNNDVSAVDLTTAYSNVVLGGASNAANVKTLYGSVKMIAAAPVLPAMPGADGLPPNMIGVDGKPILIKTGSDGVGALSNFKALGFQEGTFGGRASEDMDPPKVGRLAFQVGSSANQVVTIDLADFGKKGSITGSITGDVDLTVEQRKVRINTRDGASAVLNLLDASMDKVNATRATMGAVMNRLDHVINNLSNVSMNMSTSRSQIEDADYASSSTELAKTQIMQQAATAVLAQANTSQQTVLKLLGG